MPDHFSCALKISFIWVCISGILMLSALFVAIFYHNFYMLLFITLYVISYLWSTKNTQLLNHQSKWFVKKGQYIYKAQLIRYRQFTYLLTIITLKYNQQTVTIPIFIDSVNLQYYKSLRRLLQWH
jgi:hypothetical protein